MSDIVRIELKPLGVRLDLPRGTPLQDVLFQHGVELPCGGRGTCGGCKVRVLAGSLAADDEQRDRLGPAAVAAGWRLACRCRAESDATLDLDQWETPILADHTAFAFEPRPGWGVAIDLGTTTLVAQLLDLTTGRVLAVATALNEQARCGADVMSRIEAALGPDGSRLTHLAREQVGGLVVALLAEARAAGRPVTRLMRIALVGNTAMHHLFCGLDVSPLATYPFEPSADGLQLFRAADLGWTETALANAEVAFLPCLGGFVGSDILAGIRATHIAASNELVGLVDLGTNGEIVVGTSERLLCASTAAGPAFEGARISSGMRASTGAIARVEPAGDGGLSCQVIGGGAARGICGSGLVDAVAAGLTLGRIDETGRLAGETSVWPLCETVSLTQRDIRELQLAKGAIAAGLRLLLARLGARSSDLRRLYLAGAFGNYVNRVSARRIGLLDLPLERIEPAGNTALLGAKLALFDDDLEQTALRASIEHVALHTDPDFQDRFADALLFPET